MTDTPKPTRETAPGRGDFRLFRPIQTRWADNDIYGHVNNVIYYAYFDTAVNGFLLETGLLDLGARETVFLVAETRCSYFASVAFPDALEAGLAVDRLGARSVTYRIGIFRSGAEWAAAAGRFVHVHVDRESQRPVPITEAMRVGLAPLVTTGRSET